MKPDDNLYARDVDTSGLSDMYPVPKTYEEVTKETDAFKRMRLKRLPKYPRTLGLVIIVVELLVPIVAYAIFMKAAQDTPAVVLFLIIIFTFWIISLYFAFRKVRRLFDQLTNKG